MAEEPSGYNGNLNLKAKGSKITFTADMVEEWVKCARDPIYFAEKYVYIVHVDEGLIPIELHDFQKDIMQASMENRRVAVNTSRQAGKTTTAVCVILHFVLFNDHKQVAIAANKGDTARKILSRIKVAYEALPKWLQQGVVEWNKGSVTFENGCQVIAAAASSSNIRGDSIAYLYIDEAAFVDNWDEFFSSVFPTITSGATTRILMTSTPRGLNHFHKICKGAKEDRNGYRYIEVPWHKVPGRGEEWRKETLEGLDGDEEKFAQEFNCEFMGSSGTLIPGSVLKRLVHSSPVTKGHGMSVYRPPEPGHQYFLLADVSRGKGLDYSAFSVIDTTDMPYQQVAVFRDNLIMPYDYAGIIYQAASRYNHAHTLIEINDIGGQVADLVHYEYEVENIVYTEHGGHKGVRVSSGHGKRVEKGIRTTKRVKMQGCQHLRNLLEGDHLIIHDLETIKELATFSRRGASFQAEPGKHDDMVMGLVLFGWLTSQDFFTDQVGIDTHFRIKTLDEKRAMDEVLPLGFNSDDIPLPVAPGEIPVINQGGWQTFVPDDIQDVF